MYFLIALILHLFGVHTPCPYHIDDDWEKGVKEDEYRCIICKKTFKKYLKG